MSRIPEKFKLLKTAGRKALIPYITAGDPSPDVTVPLMHALVGAGADILELGVPFSDPMADGPVIQRATERALEHHVTMSDVLDMVRQFREKDRATPIVLMGYLNPLEVMGYDEFARQAADAGVDGAITVDIPPEEAGDLLKALRDHKISPIFLLAPTSSPERIDLITQAAGGFVYYVSLKGVTGAATLDIDSVKQKVAEIREHTGLAIGVGFGIADAEMAAQMSQFSDAVIVGSALVRRMEEKKGNSQALIESARELIGSMRLAMDANTTK
ncbi:MAG: tryptophan synthase subunit alpha [Chromatiales bacterium]|jgi:tryptophan synthase alpha chain